MDSGSFGDVTDPNIAILMGTLSFKPLAFGAMATFYFWSHLSTLQEFLKMMTHKILNRDPKDEILKARSGAVSGCCWLHSRAV